MLLLKTVNFFLSCFFFHRHWRFTFTGQYGKGKNNQFTAISTRSRALKYLFAVLHLIYLPCISNCSACNYQIITAWKVSKYGVISGPYFPAFGLNTERYLSLRIQSECGKIRTTNNSVFGQFSRSVYLPDYYTIRLKLQLLIELWIVFWLLM